MALDPEGGAALPTKKKKRKPQTVPVMGEQATGGTKVPAARRIPDEGTQVGREPYLGSTNPAFQRMGFSGDIFTFNRRAEMAATAFAYSFGYEPSPALLLDLVRAPVQTEEYEDLFQIPQSFQRARALASTKDEPETGVDESLSEQEEALAAAESGPRGTLDTARGVETMGIVDDLGLPGLAAVQIGESLVYAFPGMYEVGKALGFDTRDLIRDRDPSFGRTQEVGKAIARGVVETYKNPMENPGYIFMDAFGLVSGGAGTAARFSHAVKAGKGKRVREFTRRPDPGTDEVGGEQSLLSQNVAVAAAQRLLNEMRRNRLEKRRTKDPAPFAPLTRKDKIKGQFSTEARIGREARARQRVEHDIAMEMKRELEAVAGWAINSSLAFSHMPNALRRGLTRGELKAVTVLATDEPGSWGSKLAVHRSFHERMLAQEVGDPKAHTRQLADLALAEKVLAKPRKRFTEAAALTKEAIDQQELLKVKRLGLDEDMARSRVGAFAEVLRTGERVEGQAPKLEEGSFYLPSVPRQRSRRPVSERVPVPRAGQFGVPAPRNLPELTHQFTGESLRWGDTRIDATNLAGESYARAVRLVALKDEHKRLLAQATDQKRSEWDIPIRETEAIPEDLRAVVNQFDEGAVSKKDIDGLSPDFQEVLYQHLFPKTKVPDAKWVDARLLGDAWRYPNEPGFGTKLATAINEPIRTTTLFLRPAYGVGNLLGNSAMLLMQSLGAPNNMRKAVRANKRYGEKNTRTIEALVAEGKSLSFSPDDLIQTKISRTLAHGWSALVDRPFRVAAFIHEMERKGYKSQDDVTRLLDPNSTDATIKKHRVEISRRANKAMVEFNNLTPFEKNTMRHLVFVYPWVSRSVVWGLRTMVEHPTKTWSLVQLGKYGEAKVEESDIGEQVPEWFSDQGYFSLYKDEDGNDMVVNPQSINTFSTFPEILRIGKSLKDQVPYTSPEELSSPALDFAIKAYTGRDQYGRLYDEGNLMGALKDMVAGLPQVRAYERSKGQKEGLPPDERASFVPRGFIDAYAPLVVGGFWPRTPDTEALAADWFRDQPKEIRDGKKTEDRAKLIKARLSVERRAIMQATKVEAQILGKAVPAEVRDALELQMRFAESYADALLFAPRDKEGDVKTDVPTSSLRPTVTSQGESATFSGGPGSLTPLSKAFIQIKTLFDLGRINDDERDKLNKQANNAANKSSDDLGSWRDTFAEDYLNAKALQDWWAERDSVLDIAAEAEGYIKDLRKAGLYKGAPGKLPQETLLEAGRQFVAFERELSARAEDTGARSDLVTLDNALDRAWMDSQDKPIVVGGFSPEAKARLTKRLQGHSASHTSNSTWDKAWRGYYSYVIGYLKDPNNPGTLPSFESQKRPLPPGNVIVIEDGKKAYAPKKALRPALGSPREGKAEDDAEVRVRSKGQEYFVKLSSLSPVSTSSSLDSIQDRLAKAKTPREKVVVLMEIDRDLDVMARKQYKEEENTEYERIYFEAVRTFKDVLGYLTSPQSPKKLPSPVRLAWAKKAPEDRLAAVAGLATASWETLSNFEKEIVGKKVAPDVSQGWVVLNAVMDGYRGNLTGEDVPADLRDVIPEALPEGQRTIEKAHKILLAKWVDKNFAPGFYKDFLFSTQPKYERIRRLPIITKSKAVSEWREVFGIADGQYAYIKQAREAYDAGKKPPYTITSVQDGWNDYAKTLYDYYQEDGSDTLKQELELLGGADFLRTLIADG